MKKHAFIEGEYLKLKVDVFAMTILFDFPLLHNQKTLYDFLKRILVIDCYSFVRPSIGDREIELLLESSVFKVAFSFVEDLDFCCFLF